MVYRNKKIDKDWTVREIISSEGEVLPNKYFYKRKEVATVYLSDKLSKQLAGYYLIEKDLRNVITWLEKIESCHEKGEGIMIMSDMVTSDLVKALWVASLAFYGKCFSTTKGRKTKLDRDSLDEEHRASHDRYIKLRHNFAAHSGIDAHEGSRIALTLPINRKTVQSPVRIFGEVHQHCYVSDNSENDLLILAKHVRDKVLIKIQKLAEKIMIEEVLPKGKDYWYSKK